MMERNGWNIDIVQTLDEDALMILHHFRYSEGRKSCNTSFFSKIGSDQKLIFLIKFSKTFEKDYCNFFSLHCCSVFASFWQHVLLFSKKAEKTFKSTCNSDSLLFLLSIMLLMSNRDNLSFAKKILEFFMVYQEMRTRDNAEWTKFTPKFL